MPSRRLDFKALRASADFPKVLASYGIILIKDGSRPGQFKALCPFHDDQEPSLKVNTDKNIYHCFACEAKGNVLEFVMAMDDSTIREAAAKVADICGLASPSHRAGARVANAMDTRRARRDECQASAPPPAAPETPAETDALPTENPPLSFALKLEQDDELRDWLATRGIDAVATERFGLGRVSARSKTIAGRLAIPLHNQAGELIGYCGRHIGDEPPADVPKYIMPKGFRKEIELFNLHRYRASPPPLRFRFAVLVESFLSVIRHSAHLNPLSTMGRTISPEQIALLQQSGVKRVIIVFDGDDPGRAGAAEVAAKLAPHLWVRIVDLPDGVKPHQLSWNAFRELLVDAWKG